MDDFFDGRQTLKMKWLSILLITICIVSVVIYGCFRHFHRKKTVQGVVESLENKIEKNIAHLFTSKHLPYPPKTMDLLVFKKQEKVELWSTKEKDPVYIKTYDMTAFSGVLGPKLTEGDRQIPEGIYQIDYLNANSSFYLSLKLNYPNAFEQQKAKSDGRKNPGTNIFIHGKAASIGCVAIGNKNIEEIFILTALMGKDNVTVKIFPGKLENGLDFPSCVVCPPWQRELYNHLKQELLVYQNANNRN